MKLILLVLVNALVGLLLAYGWHMGSGVEAVISGLLALALLIWELSWLQPKAATRGPLLYAPPDRVIGLDQHRTERRAHVTHLQRGFQKTKGRCL